MESQNFEFHKNAVASFCFKSIIPIVSVIITLQLFCTEASAKNKFRELVAEGSKPEKLAGDFKFTEGPACDRNGNIFFTDQPNNRIMKWSTDGKLSLFKDHSGRANGTYFDKRGNLITCSDEKNELWSISPDGKVTVLVTDFEGKKLNGPNDLWIAPDGGIYITDPFYKRSWWDHDKPELEHQDIYYLAPGAVKLTKAADNFEQPNGIIGTPDGKYLYVADIRAKKTWRYNIGKKGILTRKKLFAEQGSDGMTIDNQGNIYMTGNGVTVFNNEGALILKIATAESWTTNVCFGGKDRHLLFITTEKSVFGIRMKVRGVE